MRKRSREDIRNSSVSDTAIGPHAAVYRAEGNIYILDGRLTKPPTLRAHARNRLPSISEACIGRDELLDRLRQSQRVIELSGPYGIGKTNLARHAARHTQERWDSVYYTDRADAVPDILIDILSCLYEWEPPNANLTSRTVIDALSDKRVLVVLDSLALDRDAVEQIAGALGEGALVIYSSDRLQLATGAAVINVPGVDPQTAVELARLRLGRALQDDEVAALTQFAAALDGHPLNFLRAVVALGDSPASFAALNAQAKRNPDLSDDDRHTLAVIDCVDGAAIAVEHLHALHKNRDFPLEVVLDRLERAGLIERHSPRVSAARRCDGDQVNPALLRELLEHLTVTFAPPPLRRPRTWLRGRREMPETSAAERRERIRDSAETILGAMRAAERAGMWQELAHAAVTLSGPVAHAGLPGAWDQLTLHAVGAAERLDSPLTLALALRERAVSLAISGEDEQAVDLLMQAAENAHSLGEHALADSIIQTLGERRVPPRYSAMEEEVVAGKVTQPHATPRRALLGSERRDRLLALAIALAVAIAGARRRPQPAPQPALALKRLFDTSATVNAHRRRRRRWTAFLLAFALAALLARTLWPAHRSQEQPAESSAGEAAPAHDERLTTP